METYIIRGRQYNVTRHYGDYEPVFAISADGKEVRVVAKKKRKQSATTWSAEEKKSIAAVKGLSVNEWHQVDYAQTVARVANRKAAQTRMDERIKNALRFL